MSKKLTKNDYVKELKKYYCDLIEPYVDKNSIHYIDKFGYKHVKDIKAIRENCLSRNFYVKNPYTIENINKYIENNNLKCKLIDFSYKGIFEKIKFRCECGNVFETELNDFLKGKVKCNECTIGRVNKKYTHDEVINIFESYGYKILNFPSGSSKYYVAVDNNGYKIVSTIKNISRAEPLVFSQKNPYVIDNINKYIEINTNNTYKLLSSEYFNNQNKLKFIHITCGNEFEMSWANFYSGHRCNICQLRKIESTHASVLKQLFLHYYPDTTLEDKSCISIYTDRCLPTDIVNHRLKIAIEIQSEFHDNENQKIKDEYKKNYWENLGYKYYSPDIRHFTILQMSRLFFQDIKKIPDWIKYDFSYKLDTSIAQKLLNNGLLVKDVASEMNTKYSTIWSAINDNRLNLPKNYREKAFNIKELIHLDSSLNIIGNYKSVLDASKLTGISRYNITKSANNIEKTINGSIFIFKEYLDNHDIKDIKAHIA